EVTDRAFEQHMRAAVLDPLGLRDSTFAADDPGPGLATLYDGQGGTAPAPRFAAPAAAGFYTTVADLSRFAAAQFTGAGGGPAGGGVLEPDTVARMRHPQ